MKKKPEVSKAASQIRIREIKALSKGNSKSFLEQKKLNNSAKS